MHTWNRQTVLLRSNSTTVEAQESRSDEINSLSHSAPSGRRDTPLMWHSLIAYYCDLLLFMKNAVYVLFVCINSLLVYKGSLWPDYMSEILYTVIIFCYYLQNLHFLIMINLFFQISFNCLFIIFTTYMLLLSKSTKEWLESFVVVRGYLIHIFLTSTFSHHLYKLCIWFVSEMLFK